MKVGEERFHGDDTRRLYESTNYPAPSLAKIEVKFVMISTEMDVIDSIDSARGRYTDIQLPDSKIDRGLFAAIALNLVLDGLSIVE